jgi:hypothetical protein
MWNYRHPHHAVIGKLQRVSPLPPGKYWIDVIGDDDQQLFAAWLFENQNIVHTIVSEHFDAPSFPDDLSCPPLGDCGPSRDWVKFEVISPVTWDAVKLGFPNIINLGEEINTSADTATVPEETDDCDIACQANKVIGSIAVASIAVAIVAAIAKRV